MKLTVKQLKCVIKESINESNDDDIDVVARWNQRAELPEFKPWIDAIKNAVDLKALAAAKRAIEKAEDAGTLNISAGMWTYFYDVRKVELKNMTYDKPDVKTSRADRILRTRDSSGRAKSRKR